MARFMAQMTAKTMWNMDRRRRPARALWTIFFLVFLGCSVDIPTTESAYSCARDDCDAQATEDAGSDGNDGSVGSTTDETDDTGGDGGCATAADCPDGVICRVSRCNAGVCALQDAKNGGTCNDGDACTEGDKCGAGTCISGAAKTCDDGSICTTDGCNKASGCTVLVDPKACDDGKPCTIDTCTTANGCVYGNAKKACDDGDACSSGDTCGGGKCLSGAALDCDDNAACTTDSCNQATGCVHLNTTATCDDGDACTNNDTCSKGVCKPGKSVNCDDGKPCTIDACDAAGKCSNVATTANCDDGDACTVGESCATGSCTGGSKKPCDDGNSCTNNSCDGKVGCVFTASAGSCDDGDACTNDDTCAASTCTGTVALTIACCAKTGGTLSGQQCLFIDKKGRKMSLIPDGNFWMGCNATKDAKCKSTEKPQHLLSMTGFWLDIVEVTAAHYEACVNAGGCTAAATTGGCTYNVANKGQHGINCVTWNQARGYCTWAGGDLPSEAQWEKAARGGCEKNGGDAQCQTTMRTYPWGEAAATCDFAAMFDGTASGCGTGKTGPVGQKPKGVAAYGTMDMAGGMQEWVRDGYNASYYSSKGVQSWQKDPIQSVSVAKRVLRGGSWSTGGSSLRASARGQAAGSKVVAYIGFRCMRAAK